MKPFIYKKVKNSKQVQKKMNKEESHLEVDLDDDFETSPTIRKQVIPTKEQVTMLINKVRNLEVIKLHIKEKFSIWSFKTRRCSQ